MRYTVVFADDQAAAYLSVFQDSVRRALTRLCSGLEIVFEEPILTYTELLKRLESPPAISLAVIDIYWPSFREKAHDRAFEPLRASLARPETVTMLLSKEADRALEYFLSSRMRDVRPHSILSKTLLSDLDSVEGALVLGHSERQLPLRSLGVDIRWETPNEAVHSLPHLNAVCMGEVACEASSIAAEEFRLTQVSGGLSGASTVLAVGTKPAAISGTSTRAARRSHQLLKFDADPEVLEGEARAHRELVGQWPANSFARLSTLKPIRFGSVSGLAFELAAGVTGFRKGAALLDEASWSLIFGGTLVERLVGVASLNTISVRDSLFSDGGLLGGRRWDKVSSTSEELDVSAEVKAWIGDKAAAFPDVSRQTAFTIAHNDLHPGNVLVSENGQAYFIDAANMADGSLWFTDLARFAVWIACSMMNLGLLDEASLAGAVDPFSADLPSIPPWGKELRARLGETLALYSQAWQGVKFEINTPYDWRVGLTAELLRASYSVESFERSVRSVAASTAWGFQSILTA